MGKEKTLPYEVIIKTSFDVDIHLEFLDNEFVEKVFNRFKELVENTAKIYGNKFNYPFGSPIWKDEDIQIYKYSFIKVVEEINNKCTVPFPITTEEIEITRGSNKTRELLNKAHRHFTTYIESEFTSWTNPVNEGTLQIVKTTEKENVYELVGVVNKLVHKLDKYFYSKDVNSRIKDEFLLDEYLIHFDNEYFIPFTEKDREYRVSQGDYQIWLPLDCMKGKNLFDCYLDFDDPTEFDIENENIYTGAIALGDRNGFRNKDLTNWLDEYKVPLSIGIPLGYVRHGKDTLKYLAPGSIVRIEINKIA